MSPFLVTMFIAAASSFAACKFGWYPSSSDAGALASLGGTLASVGATMLGFMLAALAVLASISNTHLVGKMHRTGHYANLLATLFAGCVVFLVCTIMGFVLVFNFTVPPVFMAITVGLHVAALVCIVDIGRKFRLVLANLGPSQP